MGWVAGRGGGRIVVGWVMAGFGGTREALCGEEWVEGRRWWWHFGQRNRGI